MKNTKNILPGILICFVIAIPAWLLGVRFPLIGGPIFAILIGIIIASFKPLTFFEKGIQFTGKKILQYAIIFLGFQMNLSNIIKVGGQSLFVMIFTLSAAFLTAFLLGKALKLDGKTTILIGVGTSICGGSAIAATAPVIDANHKEISQAISTIFLFNIIAVFIFPAMGHLIGLSDTGFGLWAGTAINDTSSVVAAGTAWSVHAGNETALNLATVVKLTRTLMIIPITLFLSFYMARKQETLKGEQHSVKEELHEVKAEGFQLKKIFPWFILFFILAAVINTFLPMPENVIGGLVFVGKFLIVMAMVAIGLNTHIKTLFSNGIKPVFLGLATWFVVASVSLIVQLLMNQL